MTYATPDDVKSRWIGSTPPGSDTLIQTYLDDAEVLILAEFPDLPERVAATPTLQARVRLVEVRMVTRALKNPDSIRQVGSTTGPFNEQYTYGAETLGGLTLDEDDRSLLSGAVATTGQRAFTIDMSPRTADQSPFQRALVNGPDYLLPGA